jgi:hypothetical protein
MNTITISICIDNDAFQDRLAEELASILDARAIVNGICEAPETHTEVGRAAQIRLRDTNGNTVGFARAHNARWAE